jgi:hypothetical protein
MGAKTLDVKASHVSLRTTQLPERKRYHPITEFAWLTLSVAGGYTGGYAIPSRF